MPDERGFLDAEQMDLLSPDQLAEQAYAREEQGVDKMLSKPEARYTGERLFARNPRLYELIVRLVASGLGIKRIAGMCQVHPYTVMGVRDREGQAIETHKQQIADKARLGAELYVDGAIEDIIERPDKISARDKAIIAGVLVDKSQLLSGGATSRAESLRPDGPTHEDFNAWLEGMQRVEEASEMPALPAEGGDGGDESE